MFTAEAFEQGRVSSRINEIKNLGYDAIIMDYKPGANYMVLAFAQKSVIKLSDRDPESVSNRSLLANALEGVTQNGIEMKKLQEYAEPFCSQFSATTIYRDKMQPPETKSVPGCLLIYSLLAILKMVLVTLAAALTLLLVRMLFRWAVCACCWERIFSLVCSTCQRCSWAS